MGDDRSNRRSTASKFNTTHANVDVLYKSQPFAGSFNNKNNQYMRYCESCLGKRDNTVGVTVLQVMFYNVCVPNTSWMG